MRGQALTALECSARGDSFRSGQSIVLRRVVDAVFLCSILASVYYWVLGPCVYYYLSSVFPSQLTGVVDLPMRRLSSRALLQAKPPLLSARPLPLFLSAPRSAPASSLISRPRSLQSRPSRSPLSQTSKRYCSYRRMCSSRRDEPSGSTNVQGREVLPTNVKPVHYDLTLEPDFKTFKYNGTVTIE